MTIAFTDNRITSDVTPHYATRKTLTSWAVTWLDHTRDRNGAITAMLLAEAVADPSQHGGTDAADRLIRSFMTELQLDMRLVDVKRLVAETLPVLHDALAIPAGDEPAHDDADRDLCAQQNCRECGPVPAAEQVKSCPSCPHCGETFHVDPAKTHDLTVDRGNGNVVITVEGPEGDRQVYLQEGVALDLGRALDPLTPAQIALLIGELKGGEK